jgi:serine/threonine protein kinase
MGLFDRFKKSSKPKRVDVESRFKVKRSAISGTMSNFFMAQDLERDEIVGLKIADSKKTDAFEMRFRGLEKPSEGEIALIFEHSNVVKTHEHGFTTAGDRFIVMEYIEGPGMQTLIREKSPVFKGKKLKLVRQMAQALGEVHKRGFIHRDICPRNYICSPDGEKATLFDFGLTIPDQRLFHQPGNRTGTPLYMAPEIIRRRWTDHRVDIFALGVSAYQLCTLQLPWPVTDTTGQAALAHDTQEPTDILEYEPNLNRTLATAIGRCIRSNPDERPQSIDVFLSMIDSCQADEE